MYVQCVKNCPDSSCASDCADKYEQNKIKENLKEKSNDQG